MDDRSKLHAMIDQLPEDKLSSAQSWLNGVLHPDPRLLAMVSERRQAQEAFMQRVRGTSSGRGFGVGGGTFGISPDGKRNGTMSSSWLEGDTTVRHTVHTFQSQEIETIEKFRVDNDSHEIVITRDVTSNGEKHQDEMTFSYSPKHHGPQ
jgi:hypothetical protein